MHTRSEDLARAYPESGQTEQLVVRLDEPSNPSTRLSDRARLKGWFVIADASEEEFELPQMKVEVLLEETRSEDDPLRSKANLVTKKLEESYTPNFAYLEELQMVPRKEPIPGLDAVGLAGADQLVFEVEGWLNIEALVPADGAAERSFRITMSVETEQSLGVSNTVLISIPPRENWELARGGFFFPLNSVICSEYLAIQGWAVRLRDRLLEVELFLNDVSLGKAVHGIWSPQVHCALPDPEFATNAIFSLTLARADVIKSAVSAKRLEKPIELKAIARFESGAELELTQPEVHWLERSVSEDFSCEGEIERVYLTEGGQVRIEGWVVSREFDALELYVESAFRQLEIFPSEAPGVQVSWTQRKDVELQFLPVAEDVPSGFRIDIHPLLLGRFSGQLRIAAVNREFGKVVEIGPREMWDQITTLSKARAVYGNFLQQSLSTVINFGSSLGIRRQLQVPPNHKQITGKEGDIPKRIVFASHNLSATEGAPRVLRHIVRELREQHSEETKILFVSSREGELRAELEQLGAKVAVIPELCMIGQSWERYNQGLHKARMLLRAFEADFVYANVIDSFWAIDAAQRVGVTATWAIHESVNPLECYPELDPRLKVQFLERLAAADSWIFVANATRELYKNIIDTERSAVIPNGVSANEIERHVMKTSRVDARDALGIDRDATVVTIVGTTTHRKGQDIFLREMALLKQLSPETRFKFLIVGAREGSYLEMLRGLSSGLALEDEVMIVDETPNIVNYYCASDIMVVASREESAPLVSLEAFAFGVPLVSTTAFGLGEQIQDGHNALAFDANESGELAKQVKRLVDDQDLAWRLVAQAKRDVRSQFSLEHSTKHHISVMSQTYRNSLIT